MSEKHGILVRFQGLARSLKDYLPKKEKSICLRKSKTALKISAAIMMARVTAFSATLETTLLRSFWNSE